MTFVLLTPARSMTTGIIDKIMIFCNDVAKQAVLAIKCNFNIFCYISLKVTQAEE